VAESMSCCQHHRLTAGQAAHRRLLASADVAAGNAAVVELPGAVVALANPNLDNSVDAAPASLSTMGCMGAGKNVAKRNSGLLSPLHRPSEVPCIKHLGTVTWWHTVPC
jgi:hypothetical protein